MVSWKERVALLMPQNNALNIIFVTILFWCEKRQKKKRAEVKMSIFSLLLEDLDEQRYAIDTGLFGKMRFNLILESKIFNHAVRVRQFHVPWYNG